MSIARVIDDIEANNNNNGDNLNYPYNPENEKLAILMKSLHLSRAKLKASSRVSALLAVNQAEPVPNGLLILFSVCSCLLVVVHILGLMISTCILPHLDSYASAFTFGYNGSSPHENLHRFIELAWIFSTGLGIFLFLIVVVLATWIKFWSACKTAAWAGTFVVGSVVIGFSVFAVLFYKSLISHKVDRATSIVSHLNKQMSDLDRQASRCTYTPAQVIPVDSQGEQPATEEEYFDFCVIGGGVAGVVTVETLCELISPSKFSSLKTYEIKNGKNAKVCLISGTKSVKMAVNLRRLTQMAEKFDLSEKLCSEFESYWPEILTVLHGVVTKLDSKTKIVHIHDGRKIKYNQVCIATGGSPRLIDKGNPYVVGLRDTESVSDFQRKLKDTKRLVVVGNGGIATEITHEVTNCEVVWLVKHSSISTPFLDPDAAKFLINARRMTKKTSVSNKNYPDTECKRTIQKLRYALSDMNNSSEPLGELGSANLVNLETGKPFMLGSALGPDWSHGRTLKGCMNEGLHNNLHIIYNVEVAKIYNKYDEVKSNDEELVKIEGSNLNGDNFNENWPVYIKLTNGEVFGCDLIISATGVHANVDSFCKHNLDLKAAPLSDGGGLLVNDQMETTVKDIYAIGDCAFANWTDRAKHWFQMRLWTQARHMGFQAAKCMFAKVFDKPPPMLDIAFELFTHVTTFFGFKIVLLGCYNGQNLNLMSPDCYLLMRITPGTEYVKCVMENGRMQGAILIGETDMEETFENLILDQLYIKDTEDNLLDPNIDIDDYYD